MATALLILRLVAVALLGAITHQTLAAWAPSGNWRYSFFGRFRGVPAGAFANAIVVLYLAAAFLGAVVYLASKSTSNRIWSAIAIGMRWVSSTSRRILSP